VRVTSNVRQRRLEAVAAGRCGSCCWRTAKAGGKWCEECLDAERKRKARKAARLAGNGGVWQERAESPHVPGLATYVCHGYRRRAVAGVTSHRVPQIWIPDRLCLDCKARKDRDEGVVYLVMTAEEDRADELLALSYGAIAARGR
jgi:hypothetical protein